MRITCPSCASHFELPSELLGKKGRALKCATCQHAWYQAAQVESLDLASVMGEEYAAAHTRNAVQPAQQDIQQAMQQAARQAAQHAARAQQAAARAQQRRAAAGGVQRVPPAPQTGALGVVDAQQRVQAGALGAPRDPGRNVQTGQFRQPQYPQQGAPPVPPGAVSMMSRRQQSGQQRMNQMPNPGGGQQQGPPSTAQSWFAATGRGQYAQQQQPQVGAAGGPGPGPQAAAVLNQAVRQQPAPGAPGQGAVSWKNSAPGQQQPMPTMAPLGVPGVPGGPGAPPLPGQSLRGQAGAGAAPGQAAVSWMNNPHAGPQGPMGGPQGGVMGGPMGAMGGPGAPPGMAGAIGGPGGPAQVMTGALGAPMSPAQAQAAALAGQSLRGQAGAMGGPGQGAVSWVQQPGAQLPPGAMPPGVQGQMPGAPGAPGAPAVSWTKPGGPGGPSQSMMDQGMAAGPGGPAVSQLTNEIVGPGQGSRSLLDGSQTGFAGQSMQGAQGGPGAPAPGQSMMDAGATGGPGSGPMAAVAAIAAEMHGDAGGPAAGGSSVAAGPGVKKAEPDLVTDAPRAPKAAAELKTAETVKTAEAGAPGASGGPEAKNAAAMAAALAGDDDELVDPDADRPNFGAADADETEDESADDADDGFAQIAARAGADRGQAARVSPRKPINPAYATAAMMSVIVLSIVAVLWFGRAQIAAVMPEFQSLYDRVGVEAPRPGDGLSIAESSKRLQRIGGVETLVVRGYVANIGEIPRTVPGLRLELYNEKREVIQAETTGAPAALLDPAASAEFEIRLELPQLSLAKGGYAVVWDQ